MALSYKRGKHPNASQEVRDLADSMTEQQLTDFAATKTDKLPKRASLNNTDLLWLSRLQ